MTIIVNEVTKDIFVPQADLTNLGGGLYTQDTQAFRLELRDWEASIPGRWRSITHLHNLPVTVGGTTLARVIEIINGYTITYEDGQYRVTLLGSNNNFVDVATVNQVSIVPTNSAGLTFSQEILDIHGQTQREVYIDTELVANGRGYQQDPFNNWTDGVDYAELNNLVCLALKSDADVDRQIRNFEIRGINFPNLDLQGEDMDGTTVRRINITGTHTGNLLAEDIGITNLTSGNVLAQRVGIAGTYGLYDGAFSLLTQVAVLSPGIPFVIDFISGAAGSTLGIAKMSGGLSVINMDHADDLFHVHMSHGAVTVASSCTEGNVVITGNANIIDNSGPNCIVTHTALVEPRQIHELWRFRGLDPNNILSITDAQQSAGGVVLDVADDGTTTTVDRQ